MTTGHSLTLKLSINYEVIALRKVGDDVFLFCVLNVNIFVFNAFDFVFVIDLCLQNTQQFPNLILSHIFYIYFTKISICSN